MPAWIEPLLSWMFIIVIGVWTIYAGLIKPVINPTKTTTQTGGTSYTTNIAPFSCARIPSPTQQMETTVKPVTDKVSTTVKAVIK